MAAGQKTRVQAPKLEPLWERLQQSIDWYDNKAKANQRAYKSARPVSPVLPAAEGLRATICWLVYSRVVFPVLVLQTRVSIQSGRSCFSICREPRLDAGHPVASQQRWCDESYLLAICVAYRNHQGTGRNTAPAKKFGHATC